MFQAAALKIYREKLINEWGEIHKLIKMDDMRALQEGSQIIFIAPWGLVAV